ncbi:50S ribosomal protein L11 methyltransferase [Pedobacter frigiditerrae]|uniref:Ribosomal protein L11 methyltransferase n=1 Tax=Pedobacter frigiditerrae TaxID=2530452 RepID=A0A4R0MSY8_9SPHI|nr:50S ribosomal protein L11 methyltransferase [Pedobacter frigiditerrae]TCC89104.1 50S ribosomal protein L11 methyltransferase [Pedobacter frigiditerrae]
MEYKKVTFSFTDVEEYQKDILIAELGDIGFDTFEDTETGFDAFIIANQFNEEELKSILASYGDELVHEYVVSSIAPENWNEEWEKNFTPLIINDDCYVRATFHEHQPQYKYEIVIDPKMAFGTGHHQTTTMMMLYILEADVQDKVILDMGAGTGILGILASKRGAKDIVAIDNDEVCYSSAIENANLNEIDNLTSLCGSKDVIPQQEFDIILANINRNILLDQIESYAAVLRQGGSIYFSGFYETPDLGMIKDHCAKFGLNYIDHKKIGDWVAAKFVKS